MSDVPTGNRILRHLADRRDAALHDAAWPIDFKLGADQIGIYYTAAMSRYNILNELYVEIAELLKQGDDID